MFNGLSGDNEDSFKTMRSKTTSSGQDENAGVAGSSLV